MRLPFAKKSIQREPLNPYNIFARNGISGYDFFTWLGDFCKNGFTIDLNCKTGLVEAYEKCSPVSTIINRLATSMANGKWWITDGAETDVSGEYKGIQSILSKPNPFQSFNEFIIQLDVYRDLFGEVFIYVPTPVGFSVQDAKSMYIINPRNIDPIINKSISFFSSKEEVITEYKYKSGLFSTVRIDAKNILHIKDVYQNLCGDDIFLRGKSRLTSLEYEVKNICQAQEAIYSLNQDRGAQGALVNKKKDAGGSAPLTKPEKEELQKDYQNTYGLGSGKHKIIITDADLEWQQMSFNVRDLMLFEGIKQNIESISDAYNYPFELLANSKGTTYNNKNEAKKSLYQDAVIPIANIYAQAFTDFFQLKNNDQFIIDFSDVECMQEAEKEKSEAKKAKNEANEIAFRNGVMTMEEWREDLGMDKKFSGETFYNSNTNGTGRKTES